MNYIKKIVIPVLLSNIILSCVEPVSGYSRVDFVIPEYINIRPDELKKSWGEEKTSPSSSVYIIVTLYSYSSGSETISISGTGEIQTVRGKGIIKYLVKVMNGHELIQAEFFEGSGNSREEIISSLIKQIKQRLFK